MVRPTSSFSVIVSWWAAAANLGGNGEPGNVLAGFDPEPANVLAGFESASPTKARQSDSGTVPEPGNVLAGFESAPRAYAEIVSRRTPVSRSILRKLHLRARRARTSCRFSIF